MPVGEPLPGVSAPSEERFHRRYYATTRWLRVLGLLVLVAVALGVVGSGPLSWADARQGDLEVSYERFARRGAPWVLEVRTSSSVDGRVTVTIDRGFHSAHELTDVVPQPSRVTTSGDLVTYEFETGADGEPVTIDFSFTADALWHQDAEVGLAPVGPRISFDQFIYP